MNTPYQPFDQRIDRVLRALATAPPPTGLEQRISARIAQRTAVLEGSPLAKLRAILQANAFGAYVIAPAALTVLAAVCLLIILHTNARQTAGMDRAQSPPSRPTGSALEVSPVPSAGPVTATIPLRRTESPLASPSPHWNPDAVALNETFAPSHPAPPLPLTAQEALLLRSTRRGQPMEVAELDILREAALTNRVAEQRRTGLRDTVQGLLGPLATAQALTPSSTLTDVNQPPAVADSTTR